MKGVQAGSDTHHSKGSLGKETHRFFCCCLLFWSTLCVNRTMTCEITYVTTIYFQVYYMLSCRYMISVSHMSTASTHLASYRLSVIQHNFLRSEHFIFLGFLKMANTIAVEALQGRGGTFREPWGYRRLLLKHSFGLATGIGDFVSSCDVLFANCL